jgi:hypothetical protein
VFAAVLLAGCGTTPVRLGHDDLARGDELRPARDANAPAVWIGPVEDKRSDTSALGSVAGRPFSSEDLSRWVDRELASLSSPSFVLAEKGNTAGTARLILRPRILKAYVDGLAVSKTAVIVLEVEFISPDGSVSSSLYRGQHASMNWWTSQAEVIAALKDALASCLERIRVDIEARLRSRKDQA